MFSVRFFPVFCHHRKGSPFIATVPLELKFFENIPQNFFLMQTSRSNCIFLMFLFLLNTCVSPHLPFSKLSDMLFRSFWTWFCTNCLSLFLSLFNICTWVHTLRPNSSRRAPASVSLLLPRGPFSLGTSWVTNLRAHLTLAGPPPFTSRHMLSGPRDVLAFVPPFMSSLFIPMTLAASFMGCGVHFMDWSRPPGRYLLSPNKLIMLI